jgi:glutathione S-transferase
MKLYNSIGPNPHVVRMFLAEKGIEIPTEQVDLMAGENRREPYLQKNSAGQLPALELDSGHCVTEITAICEYLEETHPNPPLIGSTPEEKAETRKWTRRVDLAICEPMANGFRFAEGLPLFKSRVVTVPHGAGPPQMAGRPDRRQGIPLRQALHAVRYSALLLPRFRHPGRPAAEGGEHERRGVVSARKSPPVGEGLTYLPRCTGVPLGCDRIWYLAGIGTL